jgi:hypothetical protein
MAERHKREYTFKLLIDGLIFRVEFQVSAFTGCAVKRRWSTAGVKPVRELVRSTR